MNNRVQIGIVAVLFVAIMGVGLWGVNRRTPPASLIQGSLVDRRGRKVPASELASKDYVLIYFSAHWCPPCRRFTPKLVSFYNRHSKEKSFEVVFVSADRSAGEMREYMKSARMPWLAVPYSSRSVRDRLRRAYAGRGGIPNLVLLDRSGRVLSSTYRGNRYVGPQQVLDEFAAY